MTIRPKLGVTLILKFIIFLIEPIFCVQYCFYILSATIIPLYFVYYIHRSAALIFRTLHPWLYEALTKKGRAAGNWQGSRSCFLRIPVSTATIIYGKQDN